MGLFGTFSYSDGRWSTGRPTAVPFLIVDVHDSGFATVDYRRADASGGRFYLRYEPRFYFDDADAADPVDAPAEAEGFAGWVREATGTAMDPADALGLLASPAGAPPVDEVVELTVERMIALAGLPALEWPTDPHAYAG
ncbi:hypothetical protein DQ237_17415 [Blastococcus sp. TF02-8]|uniref:hypothetical protein n=1 Tax=Blastococcus sp. TF02-8 TaxID=2250574 RepID=UPI000E0373D4|nr:hypothetical protein [Blastococcus sp. TF02-8]RBY93563.1 hypothetical protein DQ237_17415 [Blastococcus sp. TF02-8]